MTFVLTETIQELANEPDLRSFNFLTSQLFDRLNQHSNFLEPKYQFDNTISKEKAFSKMIQKYGCHCFTETHTLTGGRGPPRDALDKACRALSKCKRCLDIKHGDACNILNGSFSWQTDPVTGDIICTNSASSPPSACRKDLCLCETEFVSAVEKVWVGSDSTWEFNPDFWLEPLWIQKMEANGMSDQLFDRDAVCKITGINNRTANSCCGEYPNVIPFDSTIEKCCPNGKIKLNYVPCHS